MPRLDAPELHSTVMEHGTVRLYMLDGNNVLVSDSEIVGEQTDLLKVVDDEGVVSEDFYIIPKSVGYYSVDSG